MPEFHHTTMLEKGVITPASRIELARRLAEQKALYDALARETDGLKQL
jgi:hypothetical protein